MRSNFWTVWTAGFQRKSHHHYFMVIFGVEIGFLVRKGYPISLIQQSITVIGKWISLFPNYSEVFQTNFMKHIITDIQLIQNIKSENHFINYIIYSFI